MVYLYDTYKNYFQDYYKSIQPINKQHEEVNLLKYHHTFRVVEEISKLGENLNLSDEELSLAKIIALFHDVARFEQYARYQTFSDKDSVDHAELAIEIIQKNNLLNNFLPEDFYLVKKAILNHNKFSIDNDLNEKEQFFSKLIRDADKLDILHVVTNRKKYFVPDDYKKNNSTINQVFVENIKNHELVSYNDVKGMLDYVVLRASWIFDINFNYSVNQFKERKYIEKLLQQLPDSQQKKEIRITLEKYISQKIN